MSKALCRYLVPTIALIALAPLVNGCQPPTPKNADTSPSAEGSTGQQAALYQEEAQPQIEIGPRSNAVRSAKQYLSLKGFSREGLIEQLSSSAGDGYDITDATVAVDSLNVDWNNEAARSAVDYLKLMGFSCEGLIEQLSSSAGDKYTESQAVFGAKRAGAC